MQRTLRRSVRFAVVTLVIGFVSVSCGPPDDQGETPSQFDAGVGDIGPREARVQLEDGGIRCRGSYKACDGTCVDLQTNFDHCGSCFNRCGTGGQYCGEGECQCIEDQVTNCGGTCVDTSSSPDHCGDCGNACGENSVCNEGACESREQILKTVEETNSVRTMGYDCDSEGDFDATREVEGNEELHEAAQMHADNMARYQFFSHTYKPPGCNPGESEDCHDFAWRIRQTDYQGQPLGENIARGSNTAQQVVQGWADSDGHCRNMMNPQATEIGIGYAEGSGGPYWVQLFGTQ